MSNQPQPTCLYFSYGSNMDAESMRQRCPEAIYLGAGYLENYQLVFTDFLEKRSRGGADILEKEGAKVWGLLYQLTETDLAKLDANKVYPTVYERFSVQIISKEGDVIAHVWTYTLHNKSAANYPPTSTYLQLLIQASVNHHFPEEYVTYLRAFAPSAQTS